jgi:hypothetical protein
MLVAAMARGSDPFMTTVVAIGLRSTTFLERAIERLRPFG